MRIISCSLLMVLLVGSQDHRMCFEPLMEYGRGSVLSPPRRRGSRKAAALSDSRLRGNDRGQQPSAAPSLC